MNNLNGSIPLQLGSLQNLSYLHLDGNELIGSIPFSIWNMTYLEVMMLQENQIDGSIPPEVSNMKSLLHMNISFNRIVGRIPPEIGRLIRLESLDLRNNLLFGRIPPEIGRLISLEFLDLRNNLLYGPVPDSFNISVLKYMNLSYNSLSGEIPESFFYKYPMSAFQGNDLVYPISPSKTSHIRLLIEEIILPIALCFYFSVLLGMCIYYPKRDKPSIPNEKTLHSKDTFSVWNHDGRIAFEEIVKATDDFDLKYCVGTGGYGSVYRAELPNGKVYAIKKLHRLEAEEPSFDKSFKNEVKLLTEIRHRNIIKLHGFCLHRRCMFLAYEYMERGSLFYALRNDAEALELNWSTRLNIVKDIAHAMSYLHHHCTPSIIHRDLSTNNILLNNEMQAFVSDFGTARFLDPASSSNLTIVGTFGYVAPEVAYTMSLNEKSDVYSYGVVVMETIMGKHPEEVISKLLTSSIEHIKLQEILDPRLPCPRNGSLIANILQVVSYALACLSSMPNSRPTMKHISETFLSKKTVAFTNCFHDISLG